MNGKFDVSTFTLLPCQSRYLFMIVSLKFIFMFFDGVCPSCCRTACDLVLSFPLATTIFLFMFYITGYRVFSHVRTLSLRTFLLTHGYYGEWVTIAPIFHDIITLHLAMCSHGALMEFHFCNWHFFKYILLFDL